MKSAIVALVVVIVVIAGAFAVIAVKDPKLLSLKPSSTTLPETSPGIRVLAVSEVNSSMTGSWYEVANVTLGVGNLSDLDRAISNLSGSTSDTLNPVASNSSYFYISYAQAAVFESRNLSTLAFGYAAFKSVSYANLTNETIFSNITRDHLRNVTFGEVSGAFFVYGFNRTGDNYSAAIYAVYSEYFIVGFYHGLRNRTMSSFTSMISTEVSILNAYSINFVSAEHLLAESNITSALGAPYVPSFNLSFYVIEPSMAYGALKNTSTFSSDRSSLSPVLNITSNGTGVAGVAMEASSYGSKVFALGYLEATSSSVASEAYANITTDFNNSLRGNPEGLYIVNQTYNGLTFFVFNLSSPNGPNFTFSVGYKDNYLLFSVDYGSGNLQNGLKEIMEQESDLL